MIKDNKKQKTIFPITNTGFSLVELIIVIAIIAVIAALLAPNMLKYVEKTKRTTDIYTARQIADILERVVTIDTPETDEANPSDTTTVNWDKSVTLQDSPTTIIDKTFVEFGAVPCSRAFPDYYWTMKYNNITGEVISIYLGANSGDETYQLFPDGEDYIAGN